MTVIDFSTTDNCHDLCTTGTNFFTVYQLQHPLYPRRFCDTHFSFVL